MKLKSNPPGYRNKNSLFSSIKISLTKGKGIRVVDLMSVLLGCREGDPLGKIKASGDLI